MEFFGLLLVSDLRGSLPRVQIALDAISEELWGKCALRIVDCSGRVPQGLLEELRLETARLCFVGRIDDVTVPDRLLPAKLEFRDIALPLESGDCGPVLERFLEKCERAIYDARLASSEESDDTLAA